jgi:ATP synthase F1 complex assembly factor 2
VCVCVFVEFCILLSHTKVFLVTMISSLRIHTLLKHRQLVTSSRICSFSTTSADPRDSRLAGRRRFYKQVNIAPAESASLNALPSPISAGVDGTDSASGVSRTVTSPLATGSGWYTVTLDDRPLRTPLGQPLVVPSKLLAAALAAEWDAQAPSISPPQMPLQTMVCTALDQTASHPKLYQDTCLQYLSTDTICYWADPTTDRLLHRREQEAWQGVHEVIEREFGVAPACVTTEHGVLGSGAYLRHPAPLPEACAEWCKSLDAWHLTALHTMVIEAKSFLLGWALMTSNLTPKEAMAAARVEEEFQISNWGLVEGGHDYDRLNASVQLNAAAVLRDCLAIDCHS